MAEDGEKKQKPWAGAFVGDGTPGPGVKKGAKPSIGMVVKRAILDAFDKLGGLEAFVKFVKDDPAYQMEFYKLWARMAPRELPIEAGDKSAPIVIMTQVPRPEPAAPAAPSDAQAVTPMEQKAVEAVKQDITEQVVQDVPIVEEEDD